MLRCALLICANESRSKSVIHALESEHEIWCVARQRDAMAWLHHHEPETVVIDFEMDLDAELLLDAIRLKSHGQAVVIGLQVNPSILPKAVLNSLDQIFSQTARVYMNCC
jgi:hypothetical protein